MIDRTQQPWRFFAQLQQDCPHHEGTRIELTGPMRNDPDPIPVGSRGTITGGNGSQLFVNWDNGRTLILLPDEDPYRVLDNDGDGQNGVGNGGPPTRW